MKLLFSLLGLMVLVVSCESQTKSNTNAIRQVGGPCEGCEALFEYGDKQLKTIDTLPGFDSNSPKLEITGTVFKNDGKTPASDVIIYIYHTGRNGHYETTNKAQGWARRHGKYRGWIKTQKDGKYAFYTFRPAAYPGFTDPEHIHITLKEPDTNPYYIDEFVFIDDSLLTETYKLKLNNRAGSGIVKPELHNGILTVKRNIYLGLNIPQYR